ncbi:MAG: hypothetical protein J6P80_03665 [Kiritimatiellae bacterium]|nr:hypothetical protein [Kiritimatiellia bacterium]
MNALIATVVLAAQLVKLVPEDGISKAFTLRSEGDYETRVSFFRPDVFRVEVGKKVWEGEGTNRTYKVDYSDPKNQPFLAQILLPGYMEDASEVDFADACGKFIFKTSKITVEFDKTTGLMAVPTSAASRFWPSPRPWIRYGRGGFEPARLRAAPQEHARCALLRLRPTGGELPA